LIINYSISQRAYKMRRPFTIQDTRVDKNFREANSSLNNHMGLQTDPHGSSLFQTDIITKFPVLDVRAFGAKADKFTDNSVAIQNAINSASPGGYVFASGGKYLYSKKLNIPEGVGLKGVGSESTIFYYTGSESCALQLSGFVNLSKIRIQQATNRTPTRSGIHINSRYNTLQDVAVYGFKYGVHLDGDGVLCGYNDLNSVRFYGNFYDYYLTASNGGSCNDNRFFGGRVAGCADANSYGVYIGYDSTHKLNGNNFFGVGIESVQNGVYCDGIENGFYGCRYENDGNDFVFDTHAEYNVIISGHPLTIVDNSTPKRQIIITRNRTDLYSADTYLLGRYYDYRFTCNLVSPYPIETHVRGVKAETIDFSGNKWIKGNLKIDDAITQTTGTAAPTTGTWVVGDICFNSAPTAGGVPGWVCTAAGTPGTWKAMANLAA